MSNRVIFGVFGAAVAAVLAGALLWLLEPDRPAENMQPENTSGLAQGARIVSVTMPDDLSQAARIGKAAFDAKCAGCHGENAAGKNGAGPPLIHPIYRPGHHADEAFMRAVRFGVPAHHWTFGDMPAIEGLTAADVKSIIRYIRDVQKANGIY